MSESEREFSIGVLASRPRSPTGLVVSDTAPKVAYPTISGLDSRPMTRSRERGRGAVVQPEPVLSPTGQSTPHCRVGQNPHPVSTAACLCLPHFLSRTVANTPLQVRPYWGWQERGQGPRCECRIDDASLGPLDDAMSQPLHSFPCACVVQFRLRLVPRQPSKTPFSLRTNPFALLPAVAAAERPRGAFWINGGVAALGSPFSWHGRRARTRAPASKSKSKPGGTAHTV